MRVTSIGSVLPIVLAVAATPAVAEPMTIKSVIDARMRYEHVEQEGFEKEAGALTARVRGATELSLDEWILLAEGEATLALSARYDSGLDGKAGYPIVADPENVELNRLQLQYRGLPKTVITAGRQRINLDDQRFVGAVGWRDNEQTFDAARIETSILGKVKAEVTYSWSVRTIWGIDGKDARQQAIGGDNLFANLGYATPYGTLTGFAYLVDQDETAVQGYRLSSQTYGVRLSGSRSLSARTRLHYMASYARQSDFHRNPNEYAADYYAVEAGVNIDAFKLGAGHEVLGADDGRPLTSIQTPLATLHKFQGWSDKFLTTPPNGLRDLYGSVGYGWKSVAGFDALNAVAVYHRFGSDRLDIPYGAEWDAMLSVKRGRWIATAKLANYRAKQLGTDTRKLWLMIEWAY